MRTDLRPLPDACREHVDGINEALAAGDDARAFYLAYQYFRARVQHARKRSRSQDADGWCRQAAHLLAGLAGDVHRDHPADQFRYNRPLIPGGNDIRHL